MRRSSWCSSSGTFPQGAVAGPDGALYISDTSNTRVRKVDTSGRITTIAGGPDWGDSGDGGPAKDAKLFYPRGMVVDPAGNLYFVDNARIRRIDRQGVITTYAGKKDGGPFVEGGQAKTMALFVEGPLFIDDEQTIFFISGSIVRKVLKDGRVFTVAGGGPGYFENGDGRSALDASLSSPSGVAVYPNGTVLISEGVYGRIRRVGTDGIITTIAGKTHFLREPGDIGDGGSANNAEISYAGGLAIDTSGRLLVLDAFRVRAIGLGGVITTIAGTGTPYTGGDGGRAKGANVSWPYGLARDPSGNVYISQGAVVRKVTPDGKISTFAGDTYALYRGDGGPAPDASMEAPAGLAVDGDGNVYIVDVSDERVRVVRPDGTIDTFAGTGETGFSGDGGPATLATFNHPIDVAVDHDGNVLIVDGWNVRIRSVAPDGTISTIAGDGEWASTGDGGPATEAGFNNPMSIDVAPNGDIFVGEGGGYGKIRKIATDGRITTIAGTGEWNGNEPIVDGRATSLPLGDAFGLEADSVGNVFFTDGRGIVRKVNCDGFMSTIAGEGYGQWAGDGGLATGAEIDRPRQIELVEDQGDLYVAHGHEGRVRLVDKLYPKRYTPVAPVRALDTRNGTGAPAGRITAGATRTFGVVGRGGVPATGVGAVVVNVAATSPSEVTSLTAYPAGATRPQTPQVFVQPGETRAKLVTVKPGTSGRITVYNKAGSSHAIVDVVGWYTDGSRPLNSGSFYAVPPSRIFDSRPGLPLGAGGTRTVNVAGLGGVPVLGAGAAVVNVTAIDATQKSKLTVYPTGSPRPEQADVHFGPQERVSKLVTVPLGSLGRIDLHNSSGETDVAVDVVGWYGAGCPSVIGSSLEALPSKRIVDPDGTRLGEEDTHTFAVAGRGGVPATGVSAVVLDVSAVNPTSTGHLTVYPDDTERPAPATLHFRAGRTTSNLVVVPVGSGGGLNVYNSAGSTRVAVDVLGYFHLES
jgi:sugar lactone lactonase YvrE